MMWSGPRAFLAAALSALGALLGVLMVTGAATPPEPITAWLAAPGFARASLFWATALLVSVVLITPLEETPRAKTRFWVALCLWMMLLIAFSDSVHRLGDSRSLLRDPLRAVQSGAYYTYLDELLGMWLPLRLAQLLMPFSDSVRDAVLAGYRVVSYAAGAAFFAACAAWAKRLASPRFSLFLLLGAPHTLHFAGYVENYAVSSLLLTLGFAVATCALLRQDVTLKTVAVATACFSAAVLFHGVSVWSVFALAFLAASSGAFVRASGLGIAVAAVVLVPTLAAFEYWITPGVRFVHLAEMTRESTVLATLARRGFDDHVRQVLRIALVPVFAIGIALAVNPRAAFERLKRRDAGFSLAYLFGFSIHQLIWKSTIGLGRDWDLFGYTWLPLTYLAAILGPWPAAAALGFGILQALFGIGFVVAQHG